MNAYIPGQTATSRCACRPIAWSGRVVARRTEREAGGWCPTEEEHSMDAAVHLMEKKTQLLAEQSALC
jgi:hypothetical protein